MAKFEKKAEVLTAWQTRLNRDVQTADGFKKARPGQWIVDLGNGLYAVLNDADFREKYAPKDKEAEALLKPVVEEKEEPKFVDKNIESDSAPVKKPKKEKKTPKSKK